MQTMLTSEIERLNPFKLEKLPWIARVYRRPFDRWSSLGRQALFGAPNFFLFLLYQRLWPFKVRGLLQYEIGGQSRPIRFNTSNAQYRALYLASFAHGYEPQTTALINLLTPPEGVFYDIGSNWGWFSLALAARPGFRGRIHAFEPFPSSFADLSSMVEQAQLRDRIQCHPTALSDRCGDARMHLPDHHHSGIATLAADDVHGGQTVKVTTLDSLGLEPPAMMKVDVEGAEAKVFRGGAELLSKHKPMIVFESNLAHGSVTESLEPILFLRSLGYQFYRLAWFRKTAEGSYFIGDEDDQNPQPRETLALVLFEASERFLLPNGLNVFACHPDRTGEIEKHFRRQSA
jgi:FkbM family methyltransferase